MEPINRFYKALELDKVLSLLSAQACCEESKANIEQIQPCTDMQTVSRLLEETNAAYVLTMRFGSPAITNVKNPSFSVRRAEAGGSLSTRELLDIGELLRIVRSLVQWKSRCEGSQSALDEYFSLLLPNKMLEEKIFGSILSEEEIADSASPLLAEIRRKIRQAGAKARDQLEKIVHSSHHQKHLQEQIITMRDGRFVVPVKNEYRSEIPGLIHDTSGSGATVFIEPVSVVEANNKIRLLQSEEEEEIQRILSELSAEVADFGENISSSYKRVLELDVIFARAKLADSMNAIMPRLVQNGEILLHKARHPLIDKKKVVPIDISLGGSFDTLVITGPNTGGKTVSLKTLGLLTAMAMCGLMIPCSEDSQICIFEKILVDIGDEQSIEQSLSTFSSHLVNIIDIMKQADDKSLILLDELGSGTDPVEGAALAVSIIETLRKNRCAIAATTHYAEMKVYALDTPGVENACCEFNVQTLSPTYKLLIGVPGRSNAFAISQRLGMDKAVVELAKEKISTEKSRFEDVVSTLETNRQEMERQKQEIETLKRQALHLQEQAEEKLQKAEKEKEAEIEKARAQAKKMVADISAQVSALTEEMDAIRKMKNSPDFATLAQMAKQEMNTRLHKLEDAADPIKKRQSSYKLPRALKAGDEVLIIDIDKKGVVLSPADNAGYVQVQAGIIKTRVALNNVKLLQEPKQAVKEKSVVLKSRGKQTASGLQECDIRGQNVEEGIMELDEFIDRCVMAGVPSIRIIHGKGTGVLRRAIQEHLRRHKSVRTFRLGVYGEGEDGVTIAELK